MVMFVTQSSTRRSSSAVKIPLDWPGRPSETIMSSGAKQVAFGISVTYDAKALFAKIRGDLLTVSKWLTVTSRLV